MINMFLRSERLGISVFFCFIFFVVENGVRRELGSGRRLQELLRIPKFSSFGVFKWFMFRIKDFGV